MKKLSKVFMIMIDMFFSQPKFFSKNMDTQVFSLEVRIIKVLEQDENFATVEATIETLNCNKLVTMKVDNSLAMENFEVKFKFSRTEYIQLVHHILTAHNSYSGIKQRFQDVKTFKCVMHLFNEVFMRTNAGFSYICLYPFGEGIALSMLTYMGKTVGKNGEDYTQLFLNQGGRRYRGSLHPRQDVKLWLKRNGYL